MQRLSPLLAGSLALLALHCLKSAPATAQQPAPLHSGEWIIAGTANASSHHDAGESSSSVALSPSGLVFVTPHLALGASVNLGYSTNSSGHTFAYGVGPQARYYFGSSAEWLPFISATVMPQWQTSRAQVTIQGTSPDFTRRFVTSDGSLGLTRLVSTHVGISGEAYYRHETFDEDASGISVHDSSYEFGVRFGLSVFVH